MRECPVGFFQTSNTVKMCLRPIFSATVSLRLSRDSPRLASIQPGMKAPKKPDPLTGAQANSWKCNAGDLQLSCRLAIIILNFRTPEITIECLKTIAPEATANPGMQVFLIDNASGDHSAWTIQAAIDEHGWTERWLHFLQMETNLGFAGGNNLVLRELMARSEPPEYLLLLNSDTLVQPGCIAYSKRIMDADPRVGAFSCMLRNRDGTVQNVCRKFPHPLREVVRAFGLPWLAPVLFRWAYLDDKGWDRTGGSRDVDWIGGAFFFARTKALEKAGILDEDFFFYGEDLELCYRIWKSGWRVRFDPGTEIIHLGGASSDSTRVLNLTKSRYTWRAWFLIQRKCYGAMAEKLIRVCYLTMFALRIGFQTLTGRGHSEKAAELRNEFAILRGNLDQ